MSTTLPHALQKIQFGRNLSVADKGEGTILVDALPPTVNGQWVKGVGGAAVWAPILTDDFAGQLPALAFSGATGQTFPTGVVTGVVMNSVVKNAAGSIYGTQLNPCRVTLNKAGWYSFSVTNQWNSGAKDAAGKIWFIGGSLFAGGQTIRPAASTNYGSDFWSMTEYCNTNSPVVVSLNINDQSDGTDRLTIVHFSVIYQGGP